MLISLRHPPPEKKNPIFCERASQFKWCLLYFVWQRSTINCKSSTTTIKMIPLAEKIPSSSICSKKNKSKKRKKRPFYSISIQIGIKTPFYVLYKSNVTLRPLIVHRSVRCGGRFLKNQLKKMSHVLEI